MLVLLQFFLGYSYVTHIRFWRCSVVLFKHFNEYLWMMLFVPRLVKLIMSWNLSMLKSSPSFWNYFCLTSKHLTLASAGSWHSCTDIWHSWVFSDAREFWLATFPYADDLHCECSVMLVHCRFALASCQWHSRAPTIDTFISCDLMHLGRCPAFSVRSVAAFCSQAIILLALAGAESS